MFYAFGFQNLSLSTDGTTGNTSGKQRFIKLFPETVAAFRRDS